MWDNTGGDDDREDSLDDGWESFWPILLLSLNSKNDMGRNNYESAYVALEVANSNFRMMKDTT